MPPTTLASAPVVFRAKGTIYFVDMRMRERWAKGE
jgi:hypothetical protein